MFFDLYGFVNMYVFMVMKEIVKKYYLEIVLDLVKYSKDLCLGMDSLWMNCKGDGYEGFKKEYGFDFGIVRLM